MQNLSWTFETNIEKLQAQICDLLTTYHTNKVRITIDDSSPERLNTIKDAIQKVLDEVEDDIDQDDEETILNADEPSFMIDLDPSVETSDKDLFELRIDDLYLINFYSRKGITDGKPKINNSKPYKRIVFKSQEEKDRFKLVNYAVLERNLKFDQILPICKSSIFLNELKTQKGSILRGVKTKDDYHLVIYNKSLDKVKSFTEFFSSIHILAEKLFEIPNNFTQKEISTVEAFSKLTIDKVKENIKDIPSSLIEHFSYQNKQKNTTVYSYFFKTSNQKNIEKIKNYFKKKFEERIFIRVHSKKNNTSYIRIEKPKVIIEELKNILPENCDYIDIIEKQALKQFESNKIKYDVHSIFAYRFEKDCINSIKLVLQARNQVSNIDLESNQEIEDYDQEVWTESPFGKYMVLKPEWKEFKNISQLIKGRTVKQILKLNIETKIATFKEQLKFQSSHKTFLKFYPTKEDEFEKALENEDSNNLYKIEHIVDFADRVIFIFFECLDNSSFSYPKYLVLIE